MHRQRGAVLDEQSTCVSQCAADRCRSGIGWCKARYIFKVFLASVLSARNMMHIFSTSKKHAVNAVISAGEGESDPMPRTGVKVLASHCSVSDEEQYTLHSSHDAEEEVVLRNYSNTPSQT